MDDIKKIFGRNVRKYREMMGWSQAELAEKIDVSTPFMTYIEHGNRGVSMETIEALAATFGISCKALFDEENTAGQSCVAEESRALKIQRLKEKIYSSVSDALDEALGGMSARPDTE